MDSELISALRATGRRVTTPRLLVHRCVPSRDRHVTAEQVPGELVQQMPSLSSATVYETLDLLAELGLLRRVNTPRGAAPYDSRVADHHHVVCGDCGRIEDLDAAVDTGAAENAARAAGF